MAGQPAYSILSGDERTENRTRGSQNAKYKQQLLKNKAAKLTKPWRT